jgi:hypothetical protein
LLGQREQRHAQREEIVSKVSELNEKDSFLDSVASTRSLLKEKYGIMAEESLLSSVMRDELKMRYRKITAVSKTAN